MVIRSYRDLEVWQLAMDLAERCYQVTRSFPKDELFGMSSQIRRAVVSVPANIAEGQAREHTKEFLNFLSIARGSLMELETHLLLSVRVGITKEERIQPILELSAQVSRMLAGLRRALLRRLGKD